MPGWAVYEGLQYVENPGDPEEGSAPSQGPSHTVVLRPGTCVLMWMEGSSNGLGIARVEQVLQVLQGDGAS